MNRLIHTLVDCLAFRHCRQPGSIARLALMALCVGVSCAARVEAAGYFTGTAASTLIELPGAGAGILFINLNGSVTQSPPSCATSNARFAVNVTTAAGAAQAAQILSAVARGVTVWIQGSGACDVWADTETILYIQRQ